MAEKGLNVALLGYGLSGKVFHAPLIRATPGLALKVVVSSRAEEIAADLPGVAVAPDLEAALAQTAIDLVVVATPDESHFDLARRAIAAGRAVVVDKPFTISLEEAQTLVSEAAAAGVLLSVFHNRRWSSEMRTVTDLLTRGVLGQVVHYEARFDRYRPVPRDRWRELKGRGAGAWHDLGAHLIDQALHLFGAPLAIWADIAAERAPDRAPDYFHAVLHYPTHRAILHSGARGLAPGPIMAFHGDRGSYVKHGLDPQEDQVKAGMVPGALGWGVDPNPGQLTILDADGTPTRETIPGVSGDYRLYYGALNAALRGEGPNPVTPEEGLAVMKAIDLGLRSSQARRELAWA
jgi:predicted dehydrogenase